MVKIAPSILSADFANLERDVHMVEQAGADLLHVDVMDGQFVPNLTIGPVVAKSLKGKTKLPLDCHLMIQTPEQFFKNFEASGAAYISFHAEAVNSIAETLTALKKTSCKRAIALNPDTPISTIQNYLGDLDLVLVMSVFPGFAGQKFIPEVLPKIKELKSLREKNNWNYDIEIDGGINLETAPSAIEAGVDILVAGSAIYKAENPAEMIQKLKAL